MREISRRELWVCVPLALTALVYRPVLGDGFKYDDYLHLYEIANHGFAETVLKTHGGHLLLTTNLVFQLCYRLFGTDPAGYQWVSYATHLLNVALLYALVRRLTDRVGLAVFGASLWGMCPVGVGTVYWYSVYGQLLATAFALTLLIDVAGRADAGRVGAGTWARWCALAFATSVSFGTGLGVGLGFAGAATLLLAGVERRGRPAAVFGGFALLLTAFYVAQNRVYEALSPRVEPDALLSPSADLGLQSSLLGVGELLAHLVASGVGALALGPGLARVESAGAYGPLRDAPAEALLAAAWAVAAFAFVGIAWAAWQGGRAQRRRLAALLWVAACAYGVVALGRSWLQQGFEIPLATMATEPRYHYLATAALAAAACVALRAAGVADAGWARVALAVWLVATPAFYVGAARAALPSHAAAAREEHRATLAWIRAQVSRAPPGADVYLPNRAFRAVGMLYHDRSEFPGAAALFVIEFRENTLDGRRVFFVERHREALAVAQARVGTRIAELLVSPDEHARRLRARQSRGRPAGSS